MKKPFYGWIIVGIVFLIMSIVYAIYYSFPLFYVAILNEFGWSRAEAALIFSVGSIVYGFGSAVAGALLDRFGPRKVFTLAGLIIGLGLVGCSRVTELWQFFLFWGIFASFGVCAAGFVPCVALVSNWFTRKRATAVGIAQSGGRESFIMTPIIQALIIGIGWRNTYLVLAIVAALVISVSAQFLRHSPKDMGLLPDGGIAGTEGEKAEQRRTERAIANKEWAATDWTLLRGMKEFRLWALFGIMLFVGIGYSIVMTHQVAFMVDIGFTAMFASFLLLLYGVLSMSGRLGGFVSDILGREPVYTAGCMMIILGFLMLVIAKDTGDALMLYLYIIGFGFFSGLNSTTYASAAADIFQGKHFGAIFGFANIGYGVGSSFGAWFAGYMFDTTGSYTVAFIIAMFMIALASISLLVSSPSKIRLVAGKAPKLT